MEKYFQKMLVLLNCTYPSGAFCFGGWIHVLLKLVGEKDKERVNNASPPNFPVVPIPAPGE